MRSIGHKTNLFARPHAKIDERLMLAAPANQSAKPEAARSLAKRASQPLYKCNRVPSLRPVHWQLPVSRFELVPAHELKLKLKLQLENQKQQRIAREAELQHERARISKRLCSIISLFLFRFLAVPDFLSASEERNALGGVHLLLSPICLASAAAAAAAAASQLNTSSP